MATLPNTLPSRIGEAFDKTSSMGVALDIGRATTTPAQASKAGAAFGLQAAPQGAAAWQSMAQRAEQSSTPTGLGFAPRPTPGAQGAAKNYLQHLAGGIPGMIAFFARGGSPVDVANDIGNTFSQVGHKAMTTEIAGFSIVGALQNSAVQGTIRALEWGPEYISNIYEADLRTARSRIMRGDIFGGLASATGLARMVEQWNPDSEWRQNWERAVDAEASAFQTAWLMVAEQWDALQGGSSYGVTADFDRLLDDPNARAARADYFSHGAAHWTTGIGDALWQVVMDPTLIGGKAAAIAKSARSTLKADDVAAMAASRTDEAIELTKKQRRGRDFIHDLAVKLADTTDPERTGRALMDTKWLRDSSYGATIAYAASRVRAGLSADEAVEAIETVLYAGLGEKGALARLDDLVARSGNETFAVEFRRLLNPSAPDGARRAADALEEGVRISGNPVIDATEHAGVVQRAREALESDPLRRLEKEALETRVARDLDALRVVAQAGRTPARAGGPNAVATDAGSLARLPTRWGSSRWGLASTLRAIDDNPMRVVQTKNYGRFVKPVHYITGRHIPGTFQVTDPYKAGPVFESATVSAKQLLKVGAGQIDEKFAEEYASALDTLAVQFNATVPDAARKAHRTAIVEQYHRTVDDIIAARMGILNDEDALAKMRAANDSLRARRQAEAADFRAQTRYAAQRASTVKGQRAVLVETADGEYVHMDLDSVVRDGDGVRVDIIPEEQVEAPVPADMPAWSSQLQDWVALVDPQALNVHASRLYARGFDGLVARTRTSRGHQATQWLMHATNHLWKTTALLRIPAYTVRAMADTIARNVILLGSIKTLENAWESLQNTGINMRRIDLHHHYALMTRREEFRLIDHLDDEVIPRLEDYAREAAKTLEAARARSQEALERVGRIEADPRAAEAADLVHSADDWEEAVRADPGRWEDVVRNLDDAETLRVEEIVERLQRLSSDYEEAAQIRAILDERAQRRQELLDELTAAQDEYDAVRIEYDLAEAEWTGNVGHAEDVPGALVARKAFDRESAQAQVDAARERVIAAQKALFRYDRPVDGLPNTYRALANEAARAYSRARREALEAAEQYEAAALVQAEVQHALDTYTPPGPIEDIIALDGRLDALLEAYQPTPEQIARLTDQSRPMRVLVTGSRQGADGRDIEDTLEALSTLAEAYGRDIILVHGGSRGVDRQAAAWARRRGITEEVHAADWEGKGKRAGHLRDEEMLGSDVDAVLGFSAGTKDGRALLERAREAGVFTVDGGIPTPEMLRRTLREEADALRASLEEPADAAVREVGGDGVELLNRRIALEERLEELNHRRLAAQVEADEAAGVKPRRIKSGPRKGQLIPPKRAKNAVEREIEKEMRSVAKQLRQVRADLEAWSKANVPEEFRAAGGARVGEVHTADRSTPRDRELARREEEPGAEEYRERMREERAIEDLSLGGSAMPEHTYARAQAEREAREAAQEAAWAAYLERKRERALAEAEARRAEVEARRLRLEQIENRLADLDAGASTIPPLPPAVDLKKHALEARAAQAREIMERAQARRDHKYAREDGFREAYEEAARLADEMDARLNRVLSIEEERALAKTEADNALSVLEEISERAAAELTYARERRAFLSERVKKKVTFSRSGKKVRVGSTVAQRRLGLGERLSIDGTEYRRGQASDPYRTLEEYKSKMQTLSTEDAVMGVLYASSKSDLENLRRTGRWELMDPTSKPQRWTAHYIRLVNMHATKDPMARRILDGMSDEDLLMWLHHDAEGRAILESMTEAARVRGVEVSPEAIVARAREQVDTLLPVGSQIRETARINGYIRPRDVARETGRPGSAWASVADRPSVPYEMIERQTRGPRSGQWFVDQGTKFRDAYFRIFAQMPEERMGRHPLYVARYKAHFENYVNNGALKDLDEITVEQYDAARKYADAEARKDIGRFMFDTSDKSNMGFSTQLLSPFYSAWEDSMVKWYRLLGEDPSVIAKGWNIMRAPNAGGLVVDEDGNQIDVYGNVRDKNTGEILRQAGLMDGYLVIPTFGIDLRGWAGVENFRFRKDGANVVFQGDPFWLPGPGPSLAVPANRLVRHTFPELWREREEEQTAASTILRWLLPYGPSSREGVAGDVEAALPAWVRTAALDMQRGSPRFTSVWTQLYQEQYTLERLGEVEKMSDADRIDLINNRTRNWFLMRLLGTQSPVSLSPESPLAFYRKEYQRFRREYGPNADEMFRQEYPDYYDMNISVSVSETGINPTLEAWAEADKYRRQIALAPEYGWFYAGAENLTGGFNQAIYSAQMTQAIDPSVSGTTFRSRLDPLDAVARARVSEGWREYHQFMEKVNLVLEQTGISSINKAEAAELRAARDAFVQDLKERNPKWGDEYGSGGAAGNRAVKFLTHALKAYEENPELAERSDGQALMRYIEFREKVRNLMILQRSQRGAPGSSSLNAAEFDDAPDGSPGLRTIWEMFVQNLVASDAGFAQMYTRVLERDDLSMATYQGGE